MTFTFDNFPQAEFAAIRWQQKRETMSPWGREVREAGWIDLYVTLTVQRGRWADPSDRLLECSSPRSLKSPVNLYRRFSPTQFTGQLEYRHLLPWWRV